MRLSTAAEEAGVEGELEPTLGRSSNISEGWSKAALPDGISSSRYST